MIEAVRITLPESNSLPLKIAFPNRKVVFQASIFRGENVSLRREGKSVGEENHPSKFSRSLKITQLIQGKSSEKKTFLTLGVQHVIFCNFPGCNSKGRFPRCKCDLLTPQ